MYALPYATLPIAILTAVFSFLVLFFIFRARRGKKPKIRKIPGLDAINDAVGRATEMGRPMMYTPGLVGIDPICMASMAILKSIVKLAAQYDTRVIVAIYSPEVIPYAEEICRQAYTEGGKPNLFSPDDVRFISQDQFAYASGTVGLMHREKVAANFMMGSFAAESLILAETGQQIGAIQVAGTTSYMQLPFFITTCDYTIIGEEYFAGSAYLTQDPVLLGSLFGQDLAKMIILGILLLGIIYSTAEGLDDKVRPLARNPVFRRVLGMDTAKQREQFQKHVKNLSEEIRSRSAGIAQAQVRLEMLQTPSLLSAEVTRLEKNEKAIEERIATYQADTKLNDRSYLAVWENRLNNLNLEVRELQSESYLQDERARLKHKIKSLKVEVESRRVESKKLYAEVIDLEAVLTPKLNEDRKQLWAENDRLEREIIDAELGD